MMSVSTLRAHSIHTSPIIAQINTCTMAAIMDANTILLALQESHQWEVDDFTVMLFDDPSSDTPVEVNLKDWVKGGFNGFYHAKKAWRCVTSMMWDFLNCVIFLHDAHKFIFFRNVRKKFPELLFVLFFRIMRTNRGYSPSPKSQRSQIQKSV
jgi:hypothetical protein